MGSRCPEDLLWNRVLAVAEAIDQPGGSVEQARHSLCGLQEGFGHAIDPAEDFPAWVTLRLCRAVEGLLGGIQQRGER